MTHKPADPEPDDIPFEDALALSLGERPALVLDVEKFQSYLDDFDWPEQDKTAFLEAMWSIIVCFVDLGYGVHPLQLAASKSPCGQLADKTNTTLAFESATMVKSDNISTTHQSSGVGDRPRRKGKET